jgi:hypothetical protein
MIPRAARFGHHRKIVGWANVQTLKLRRISIEPSVGLKTGAKN